MIAPKQAEHDPAAALRKQAIDTAAPILQSLAGNGEEGDGRSASYSAAIRGAACSSSAARSFGGDIGRSRSRSPVASAIALATAAIGGTIGTSPTPRAPNGCRGLGTSIRIASIIGKSEQTGTR